MNNPKDQIDPRLESLLDELRDVSARDPKRVAQSRVRYLSQAVVLREEAVSRSPILRLREWLDKVKQPKEFKMTTLVSIITILGLLMGGTAGTVYASQDSLPNEALYGVKIASENIRLNLTSDTEEQLDLLLEYANRRNDEIETMVGEGIELPADVMLKWYQHTQQAMQVAGELDGEAKLKVENTIRNQMQRMMNLQENASEEGALLMEQARVVMENQLKVSQDSVGEQQGQGQSQDQGQSQGQGQGGGDSTGQPDVNVAPGADNGQALSNSNQGEDPCVAYYASLALAQGQDQSQGKGQGQGQGSGESQGPIVYGLNGEICPTPTLAP